MDRLFQQARTPEVHSIVRGDNRQLVAEATLAAKAIFEGRLLVAKLPPSLYAWTMAKGRHGLSVEEPAFEPCERRHEQWIAYSNKLAHPKYIPLFGVTIDNWWQKQP